MSGIYDYYDELRLCENCGDRYCTGDICHECERQEMIDNDPNPPEPIGPECINCGKPFHPIYGQFTVFGNWFCAECLD